MPKSFQIQIPHITRVEGHGNLVVRVTDGHVEKAEWQVVEAPRFFEAFVQGRRWDEIQAVVSRICGICSISHSLVSIQAIENALHVQVSPEVQKLRSLTHASEILQSHILHIGYLVAPDLFKAPSVIPLVENQREVVQKIIELHRIANQWSDLLAGRTTHPITLIPGGFTRTPSLKEFENLQHDLSTATKLTNQIASVILSVAHQIPHFERETEYIALQQPGQYSFESGQIASSDLPELTPVENFESVTNEYVTNQSTAKWARWHRGAYAVGALARYNLNHKFLRPAAAQLAHQLGIKSKCINPYANSLIQLVECVQILGDAQELIDFFLENPHPLNRESITPRAGEGVAAIEAPRGILFHRYQLNDQGICRSANLCIPTNQNHGNLQKDIETLLPQILHDDQESIRQLLEMLVRSYDPCISCSTHFLNIKFIDS
jgi:coenzyme F420-reducing hydrogenase alpha subunit